MSFSGIILAGGKSRRMGQDKALLEINGKPMIQHVSELLREFCDEIIISSANKDHAKFGDSRVEDLVPNAGPLAGIQAGLITAKNEQSFVLSCDTPFVTKEVLEKLRANSDDQLITVSMDDDMLQPLIAIYNKKALPTIEHYLERDERTLFNLQKICNAKVVYFFDKESRAFENINTQEDWKRWDEK